MLVLKQVSSALLAALFVISITMDTADARRGGGGGGRGGHHAGKAGGGNRVANVGLARPSHAPKRIAALPDVPTMAEAGLPGQESDTISGVLVPARTPRPIIELLHREVGKALVEPDAAQKLASLGFDTIDSTPEEHRFRAEIPKWAKVIQMAGIKAE
jgi:hypothetical protein